MAGRDLLGQLLLIRSATTLILLAPFIWWAGRDAVSAPRPGLQVLRIVLSTLEVAMFFWAVGNLPLADAVTFYLAGPIYVTAISALFLESGSAGGAGARCWPASSVSSSRCGLPPPR